MESIRRTITLLGTGTSQGVPVLGCHCPTCLSRDPRDQRFRTAALLRADNDAFAIDTGPDFRTQLLREKVDSLNGVLITHEHNDHTAGLDDIRPYCFRQKIDMPVHCLPRVAKDLRQRFAYAFSDYPGVPRLDIREVSPGDNVSFGEMDIELVEVVHGQLPILGFRWGNFAYLADVKTLPPATLDLCRGAKTVVISALHHEGTHSHLSLKEALGFLEELEAQRGVLVHFSHRMGTAAELQASLPAGVDAGYDGMRIRVEE